MRHDSVSEATCACTSAGERDPSSKAELLEGERRESTLPVDGKPNLAIVLVLLLVRLRFHVIFILQI